MTYERAVEVKKWFQATELARTKEGREIMTLLGTEINRRKPLDKIKPCSCGFPSPQPMCRPRGGGTIVACPECLAFAEGDSKSEAIKRWNRSVKNANKG